jgi:hypothetical protein
MTKIYTGSSVVDLPLSASDSSPARLIQSSFDMVSTNLFSKNCAYHRLQCMSNVLLISFFYHRNVGPTQKRQSRPLPNRPPAMYIL